ncbi:RNA-binding protein 41 isoform X2 [Magallana gigas]|uniref:RNA-binding protein 41 isoform X2 n=1 Tax=Magallana gigas TaxID=29159 RepID=UPI003340EACB
MDLSLQKKRWRPEIAPPDEEVITEGQKQLKNLLDKQLQKDVTIQQQLSQKRTFTSASAHCPAVNSLSGLTSLDQFQEVDKLDAYTEELKKCGLTDEEIQLKMMADDSNKPQKKRNFGIDPSIMKERLQKIQEKIEKKNVDLDQKDKFHGQKALTRHEMELERSLLRDCNSDDKKKVMNALTTVLDPRERTLPNDPMSQLPEILENITKGSSQGKSKRRKRKQKNKEPTSDEIDMKGLLSDGSRVVTTESYTFDSSTNRVQEEREIGDVATCEPRPRNPVPEVSLEDIQNNRLAIEEIKNLPRFENYAPGELSKILYLKNLSNKVHQQDLESIFNKFLPEGVGGLEYRVLTGRMRGQAFITFPDTNSASRALEHVNGYLLKDRPIIIQYGRKNSSSNSPT